MSMQSGKQEFRGRQLLVLGGLALAALVLVWRAVDLHVVRKDFLQGQGDARYLRVVSEPANRGMITDRYGEPLAISSPVDSIWANPRELAQVRAAWPKLAKALGTPYADLKRLLAAKQDKEFIYLKRRVSPDQAAAVMALEIPGVALEPEFKRFYPAGEVTAHVVGFSNVDDQGQEGAELAFESRLRGIPGAKRVIRDRLGRIVENVERVSEPRPGEDIALSIDRRLQYLAYRELKAAVLKNRAGGGSAVILDVHSGEVLAMVNQPSFNPNNRDELSGDQLRNRAVTDVFEPGSTIKPFTAAAALESGKFRPQTLIDTHPGKFQIGRKIIHDFRDYGVIDVSTVIQKSSNIGASKLALAIPRERLWNVFVSVGLGEVTRSQFPGEAAGLLADFSAWREIDRATVAYGYGLSVTTLQLTRAYAALASDGRALPVSFVRRDANQVARLETMYESAINPQNLLAVRRMMETVIDEGGTGTLAAVSGYRIGGKTGTSKKSAAGGYLEDSYQAIFAGFAPASQPRLAMVVVIDDPRGEEYYGGAVAAPVFANVMAGALRIMDIAPDNLQSIAGQRLALAGKAR